ncbi:L-threonylcarbamoyladenylate synthase [uncultured Cohaesibacter sp.]|uniref:L-threonylcarbamoyladenylate synthase n=1 Tax=uncultured Cohaesibacter sp. TaxID=1002546 RepID=UPI00292DD230|nr:L-threonylcarbamoyladenylate synthase [uncultured Cohaesibacter sp.]
MTKRSPLWHPQSPTINPESGAARDALALDDGFGMACDILVKGGLVAVPTETVYGLAADATNAEAIARIYAAKNRPSFNPLISHLPSLAAATQHGIFNADALALAKAFWPGPMTLVVAKRADSPIAALTSAGLDTVALRVPDAPLMRALAYATGKPLAAPSANRSGRVSPTTAEHVREELSDRIDLIADLGPCKVGVESSVILCVDDAPATLLRPGGLSTRAIEAILKRPLARAGTNDKTPSSPGMTSSHYAPSVPVRLNAVKVEAGEALIAFGPALPENADRAVDMINLSETGDSFEAAQKLFAAMRTLDRPDVRGIAVAPIPNEGLGEAINDRLRRAAF